MNTQSPPSLVVSLLALLLAVVSCAAPQSTAAQALRSQVGAYELEVLVDGVPARTFVHAGETHVLGQQGSRYVLRVHNRSARRIEAVVSVDGLDVIDGKAGDFAHKRGYLVDAHGFVDIEGFRLSQQEAAAFRFAAIAESYAAKTGSARNVGVIGVAVFPERIARRPVYAPVPSYRGEYRRAEPEAPGESLGGREAKGSATRESAGPAAPPAPASTLRSRSSGSEDAASTSAEAPLADAPARRQRGGLGTEFGEAVTSEIRHVAFTRAHATRPAVLLGARYNDRAGLYALGIDVDGVREPSDLALRQTAQPFPRSAHTYARPPADWRRD
jgi:hypothetical protein